MRKKEKICFVANTAWSIYNFRRGLLNTLIENGYQVFIVAPRDEEFDNLESLGCCVIHVDMEPRGVNPIKDLALIFNLLKIYKEIDPFLIFHYTIKPNIYGSIAARLVGVNSVAVTTGLGYTFLNNNLIAKVARVLYRFSFKFPKEVWFLNKDDMSVFCEMGMIEINKARLLPSEGVNTYFYRPTEIVLNEDVVFLLIARMLWDKGVGEYVEAAKLVKERFPKVRFQLLGACGVANPSVIEREQVADWESKGIVEYLGTTDDVRPYISAADCIVLPSYREGVPRTLLEAASMAKPLIATDVPGCRDVIVNGITGFLCEVKNASALADTCIRFINCSGEEREALGLAGRKYVSCTYDEKIIIKQYLDLIKGK